MSLTNNVSVGEQVVSSILWLGSWRWTARLIGFATTVILARLLLPEDFGIVATGAIIVGFFTIIIELGTDNYLIRMDAPKRDDYDTAWTLRFLVISLASAAVFFAAPLGADFFDEQRLVDVLRILAFAGWLNGLENIGLTKYRRDLQFRKIAIIGMSKRLCSSATIIILAFVLENYWAMVIGQVVFVLVGLSLSYIMHNYRPRFTLVHIRKQWEFCKWIVARNLATFMQTQGDQFIVAKFFGIEVMGLYAMGMRFAALPTKQVLAPVLAPVYSGLAKKQQDPEVFAYTVLKVIGAIGILMLPAAALFASLGEYLILAILGERWVSVIPLVAPLTISIMLLVLTNPAMTALTLKGKVKLLAGLHWFSAFFIIAALLAAVNWNDIEILAWARVVITFLLMLIYYVYLRAALNISVSSLLATIYRPIVASGFMLLVISWLSTLITSSWMMILSGISAGGMAYVLTMFLLWRVAGSPDSGEVLLLGKLAKVVSRKLKK
jgi:lipopolysaccharide exporter